MRRATVVALVLLVTVPTCATLPRSLRDLPPVPREVPSILGPVPVRRVHHLLCGGTPALGCYTYATRTIELEDTLTLLSSWVVLRHEIGHAALDAAGVRFTNPEAENHVVQAWAVQQVVEMRAGWPR